MTASFYPNDIRVLLKTNYQVFREAVTHLIFATPGMTLVKVVDDSNAILTETKRLQPHVILTDLDDTVLKILPQLRAVSQTVKVIGLPMLETKLDRETALQAGVDATVIKASIYIELVPVIRQVAGRPTFR